VSFLLGCLEEVRVDKSLLHTPAKRSPRTPFCFSAVALVYIFPPAMFFLAAVRDTIQLKEGAEDTRVPGRRN